MTIGYFLIKNPRSRSRNIFLYLEQSLYPALCLYQGANGSADHGEYPRTHYIQTKLVKIRTGNAFIFIRKTFYKEKGRRRLDKGYLKEVG